jgi:Ca-activated chloride channel family protein
MSFLAPIAFWFAVTLPVVVVFYLLKRKRQVKLISSTLLWQKFLAETQANAPFQKLRNNWLMIFQLLLLALAVFALARPYFLGKAKTSELRVVILDASASMQATDVSPSRFEAARTEALKLVDALKPEERMMVLLAGGTAVVKQSPTTDKATLRRALQDCQPTDSPTRLADALKTASAFSYEKRGESEEAVAEIHLFSDGAVPDLAEFENKALPLVFHKVGERANNLGIIALEARPHPDDPRQRAIYTSVANFSLESLTTELELLFENVVVDARSLTLESNQTAPQVFVIKQSTNGVFSVRISAKDDLAADNSASVYSILPQPAKVLLVTRGNRFLEKALHAVPNLQLATATDCTDNAATFDYVILDGVTPTVWPEVNVLAFRTTATNWFDNIGRVESPALVDWRTSHALLRYAPFDNVAVKESAYVKAPSWAVSLLEAPQGSLLVAGELGRQRIVWLGFDVLDSNWPLRVSFPIFIANAAEWLNPASARNAQLLVKAGDPFRLKLLAPVTKAEVQLPDGKTRALEPDPQSAELVFGDTAKEGVYRLTAGTNTTTFCVNLLDANESNIKPREELSLGQYTKITASKATPANTELWRTLAIAALVVLLFEWWWYHRRTA